MPIVIPGPTSSTSSLQSVPTQQVFDYLYDTQGNPLPNRQVVITLNVADATTITPQVELSSVVIRATTDQNGYWTANLIPNANINPANTTYSVQPPGLDAYQISIPASGGPFQSTSPSVLVNTPGTLAAATTGITGSLTVSGNETISGTLGVTGATTLGSLTASATTLGATAVGGDLTIQSAFRLLFGAAVSKIVPGATSISLRDNGDANDNLIVTNAGLVTVRSGLTVSASDVIITAGRLVLNAAAAKIKGGATSLSLRNNADSADNVLVLDNGNVTIRGTVQASNLNTGLEARMHLAAATANLPGGGVTQTPFDAVTYDPNSNLTTGATAKYTVPTTGKVLVVATVTFTVQNNPQTGWAAIFKNGTRVAIGSQFTVRGATGGDNWGSTVSDMVNCTAGDTLDIRVNNSGASAAVFVGSAGADASFASFRWMGP